MPFCQWLQNTSVAVWIAGSDWAYPFVQLTHLTGRSLWIGSTIALDLHLMGVGERRQTPSRFSDALFVWNWIGAPEPPALTKFVGLTEFRCGWLSPLWQCRSPISVSEIQCR
jgi:hypothetical protein